MWHLTYHPVDFPYTWQILKDRSQGQTNTRRIIISYHTSAEPPAKWPKPVKIFNFPKFPETINSAI